MNVCPLVSHPDWIELVSLIGEKKAYEEFLFNGFDIPNPRNYKSDFDLDKYQMQVSLYDPKELKVMPTEVLILPEPQTLEQSIKRVRSLSFYNPVQAEIVYRNLAQRTATKLLGIEVMTYNTTNNDLSAALPHEIFMRQLRKQNLNALDLQIVEDFLNHNKSYSQDSVIDTHKIAEFLNQISVDPRPLDGFYNTRSQFSPNEMSSIQKFEVVASDFFGDLQWSELVKNFAARIDSTYDKEDWVNPITGKQWTIHDLLVNKFELFLSQEKRMKEIIANDFDEVDLKSIPIETVLEHYRDIRQGMGKLIWDQNEVFIKKMADRVGLHYETLMRDIHEQKNKATSKDELHLSAQVDMPYSSIKTLSITDFGDNLLAMQYVSREVSKAALKADSETLAMATEFENLLMNVVTFHHNHKPQSWIGRWRSKVWSSSKEQTEVFGWMLEKDAAGELTGKTIARYVENEGKFRELAFERKKDSQGRETKEFKYSNKVISDYVTKHFRLLLKSEQQKYLEVMSRNEGFESFGDSETNFPQAQRVQAGRDTTFLRTLFIKVNVRQKDSSFFSNLKAEAKLYAGTARGNLAQAKIALYDFIYEKNTDLLAANGNDLADIERTNMSFVYADFQESVYLHGGFVSKDGLFSKEGWKNTGWSKAWDKFWTNSRNETDNDAVSIQGNVIVSMYEEKQFKNSKRVPYRTLNKKKDFSANVPAIFRHHFSTLIYKKNYDPVLPILDAAQVYYNEKKKKGDSFENVTQYIEEYANQRLFFQKSKFDRSAGGRVLAASQSLVVSQFLGLAPLTSLMNLTVGFSESYKHMIGEYGLGPGTEKFKKGFGRMLDLSTNNIMSGFKDGYTPSAFSKKALAILHNYGIETFATSDVFNLGNQAGQIQDMFLTMQRSSEILIRGASLMAELSDEQWDAFSLNDNGILVIDKGVIDDKEFPLAVAEWKNKIGNIQGKYDNETKRIYSSNAIYKGFALFKGWVIDYFRNRFIKTYRDQFGVQREGYWTTGKRLLLEGYKNKGFNDLTELEQQNVRKMVYDIILLASIMLIMGAVDDDDEEESFLLTRLAKLNSQLFLFGNFTDMVNMVKNPFAGLYHVEVLANTTDALIRLQGQKALNHAGKLIPGKQIYTPVIDAFDDEQPE